jgi:4-hydroxy-4-methyl-2-oxoglutarate aldolase
MSGTPHVVRTYERTAAATVAGYHEQSVATVHEAQGRAGAMAAHIQPLERGSRVCGTALTVSAPPGDNLVLHKAIDIVQPGEVLVVDIDGWEGGPWGELMSVMAAARGCDGLVIDGYVRDIAQIRAMRFDVFARGTSVKGATKERPGLVNHPISCGGVIVRPGDLVLGDDDGVCVVPRDRADEVLAAAQAREQEEQRLMPRFAKGAALWELADFDAVAERIGLEEELVAAEFETTVGRNHS